MEYPRGSVWSKWDLHVHSPASFNWNGGTGLHEVHGGDRDALLQSWIEAINKADASVFAVMDYWTFDGYLALREYVRRHPGELRKTVLPGIELRVQSPTTHRLDIHAILSDELPDQRLRDFLSKLHVQIINGQVHPLSPDCLREYARSLRDDQLKGRTRAQLADDDFAWRAGSETCEVTLDSFRSAVKSLLPGSAVIFQPWDTYHGLKETKWRDHYTSAYQLFEQPDIFECKAVEFRSAFIGSKTPENEAFFDGFWAALGERPRLAVRGSDAHSFGDYGKFQSNLMTWIKAAPTFRGLLQAIKEPQQRSWLGDVPPKVEMRRSKPTVFIDRLQLRKIGSHKLPNEDWFDGQMLELNPDLVAVIGSKGSGKSALADIVALLGDTTNTDSFEFLKAGRFRDRKNNRSQHFEGELTWANGLSSARCLADDPPPGAIERVRYIPQSYFERVCAGQSETDIAEFTGQIERVIFAHVPSELRGDASDLKELLGEQETEANRRLERLRTDVRQLNADIRELKARSSPSVLEELCSLLKLRKQQLEDLERAKPTLPAVPVAGDAAPDANTIRLQEVTQRRNDIAIQIEVARKAITQLQNRQQALLRVSTGLRNLQAHVKDEFERLKPDASLAGIEVSAVARFDLQDEALVAAQANLKRQMDEQREATEGQRETSLTSRLSALDAEAKQVRSLLDTRQLEIQAAREKFAKWEAEMASITGTGDVSTTIAYVELQIAAVNDSPGHISTKRQQREAKVREIAEELLSIKRAREALVAKARATIDAAVPKHPSFSLGFINELVVHNLEDPFFDLVKQVSGTFRGEDEGRRAFRELVESKELGTADDVVALALGLEQALAQEQRDGAVITHELDALVRKGKTPEDVLNLLYSLEYVRPRFSLAQAGQPLTQLSPGQRGALLRLYAFSCGT